MCLVDIISIKPVAFAILIPIKDIKSIHNGENPMKFFTVLLIRYFRFS